MVRRPGIEPGPPAWKAGILTTELTTLLVNNWIKMVTGVGFEPTPPKRLVPKTSALDHSATQPCCTGQSTLYYDGQKCSMRGSNPRPPAHKTRALPTAPMEQHASPGIEPGAPRWRRGFLPLNQRRDLCSSKSGESGFRSRCLVVANDALYRLS